MTSTPCATCGPALIRNDEAAPYDIDPWATTDELVALAKSGRVREVRGDIPLADMPDLFASDLMYTIVSYVECLSCRRTIFWGLCVRGAPIFKYVAAADVDTHRWETVPPREKWAGALRKERERARVWVIDHQPGAWFLLERGDGELLLDARYSDGAVIDDSVVIVFSDKEVDSYRNEGRVFIDQLQERIHSSAPYRRASPWHGRNLKHLYGAAVHAAITASRP